MTAETSEFTCWDCGGTFQKNWSDDKARAEAITNGFDPDSPNNVTVCDDCYVPPPWIDPDGCRAALTRRGWLPDDIEQKIAEVLVDWGIVNGWIADHSQPPDPEGAE